MDLLKQLRVDPSPASLVLWVDLVRRAVGEERENLLQATEGFYATAITPPERAMVDTALAHLDDGVPLDMVRREIELAAAERRVVGIAARTSKAN